MYPTLFISHGAPNIVLQNSKTKANINKFAKTIKKPKYIIIFSAHYTSEYLKIINHEAKSLMYDFYGFEKELYEFSYEIKSDKKITEKILEQLKEYKIDISIDKSRDSYDHGVWTTLSMMYEKLDIPVIQISVPMNFTNQELIKLGNAFQIFKDEAMIIASGGITHNLMEMKLSNTIENYAKEFNDYIIKVITSGNEEKLLESTKNEYFLKNHPTKEHFIPLFIAFGSAFNKRGISFNSEFVYSNISLECFVFDK